MCECVEHPRSAYSLKSASWPAGTMLRASIMKYGERGCRPMPSVKGGGMGYRLRGEVSLAVREVGVSCQLRGELGDSRPVRAEGSAW